MTKIILLVVLSVALGVNAGTLFRGARNIVEVPLEIVKEPIAVELIKDDVVLPVEQLRITDEVKIEEPVAVISEKIVNNEENRVETIVVEEVLVPQLKAEVEEPVVVDVVETVKSIVPVEEPARVETVAAPVESEQKVEILEAVEPGVKTTVVVAAEEEQTPTELRQSAEAPAQTPAIVTAIQNLIQNNPIATLLNNRVGTANPQTANDAAINGEGEPAATSRPNLVQQIQTGLQNVGQQIANTLSGGAPVVQAPDAAEGSPAVAEAAPARPPTLLQNIQSTIGNILNRPSQAAAAAAPAPAPAASSDGDTAVAPAAAPAPAEKPAPAAPAPAGPVQALVSTFQNLLNRNDASRKPADASAKPVQPVAEKSVEPVEEPAVVVVAVQTEEEEPKKEQ